MTPAVAQDEDILIISDTNQSDSSHDEIKFSFDFGGGETSSESVKTQENILTPDTNVLSPLVTGDEMGNVGEVSISPAGETSAEIKTETPSFSLNLDALATPVAETAPETIVEQENVTPLTFGDISENLEKDSEISGISEITSPSIEVSVSQQENVGTESLSPSVEIQQVPLTVSENNSESLNDILAATIAKLTARKEIIGTQSSSTTASIQELKKQVAQLEEQIAELEAHITEMSMESQKIDTNIAKLEEMKLDPVKEHHEKRSAKKSV